MEFVVRFAGGEDEYQEVEVPWYEEYVYFREEKRTYFRFGSSVITMVEFREKGTCDMGCCGIDTEGKDFELGYEEEAGETVELCHGPWCTITIPESEAKNILGIY